MPERAGAASAGAAPASRAPAERDPSHLVRIGEAALETGVSERTLRYYEELGLLSPATHPPGRSRRYGAEQLARVRRIRELQETMGLNLEEIRRLLDAEARIEGLRAAWERNGDPRARLAILDEGLAVNLALRARVERQLRRASDLLAQIDARLERIEALRAELTAPPARRSAQALSRSANSR
ncbi:MAG TPA: MerR family transcriptional regulator [Acidimicrobiales bacterium]|nr:MerR family transcriptional regulator [Acidimicrobiales bacterium]